MIRVAILSDLHIEKGPWHPPVVEADLVVLAGDIGWGPEGMRWAADHLGGRPAVYVAGNREYWHHAAGADPTRSLRELAENVPNLRYLQDDETIFTFGGHSLRVLGTTLWTDFRLEGDAAEAMVQAESTMPDYRYGRGPGGAHLTSAQVLAWNRASVAFLTEALVRPFAGPTVVVTHHAPSARSRRRPRPEHVPTTASITELDELIIRTRPELWIHGHTHWNVDYQLGTTRVVTNQRGEPENEDFAPLVVELTASAP